MASTCDQMQLQRRSTSFNDELLQQDAQFQKYMGTYVMHSCTSSSTTRDAEAPLIYISTSAESGLSIMRRGLPPAAGADFRVPALHCSFTSSLHPHYEVVKEQCDEWILDVAQPPCAAARQLLQDCAIPLLICRNIPNASSNNRLVHATKMIAWLFITDDEVDHPDALGADEVHTMHHACQVLSILRGSPAAHAPAAHEYHVPFDISSKEKKREAALLALAELWAEMRREMSPRLCARFVSTMEEHFDAVKVQATYRKANKRLPSVQAYKEIRRHASFILPCFVLVEYAVGIDLDEATYANARIQEFRIAAMDHIWLSNDLISCKMEIGVGDYFNMPSIVYAGRGGLTLQGAVDIVADMVHDMDARCVSLLQTIFEEVILSKEATTIRTYLSSLCNCMSGSLAWHLETPRYATT
uniref:Terpene synthase n=1 Tax=Myriopteris rufa TaxID=414609 RepID=A0A1J0CQ94_9MONI|nr:terpene synthase 3 [Myriopteris rufa]